MERMNELLGKLQQKKLGDKEALELRDILDRMYEIDVIQRGNKENAVNYILALTRVEQIIKKVS